MSALLLALLTAALFMVFRSGASSWKKIEAQTELLQQLQNLNRKVADEAQRSVYTSLSVSTDSSAISFLSPIYAADYSLDPNTTAIEWRAYSIFYHDPNEQVVYHRFVPLNAGDPEIYTPAPIETWDTGLPIESYLSGGRIIAREIYGFSAAFSGPLMTLNSEAQRDRYGRPDPEVVKQRTVVNLRNN